MRRLFLTVLALGAGWAAAESELVVHSQVIPHGIRLDAGSGPKEFLCVGGRITHKVNLAGRVVNTSGKYLTLTFDVDDQHLNMEAHDQQRPLDRNQVHLTCNQRNEVQVKVGSLIEVDND